MQEGDTAVLIREYEQKALALQAERDVFDQQLIPKCLDNALAQTQNVGGVLDGLLHSMHTLKQSSSIDDSSGEECQRLVEFLKEKIAESDKLCKSLEYLTLFREVLVLR